jgi:hypothetical protein
MAKAASGRSGRHAPLPSPHVPPPPLIWPVAQTGIASGGRNIMLDLSDAVLGRCRGQTPRHGGHVMATIRIELRAGPRGHGKTPMFYQGKFIGSSHSPIYAGARRLLENGLANSDDEVATYRGSTLCQSDKVGELPKWTVEETKHGNPSLIFRRWKAFRHGAGEPPAAGIAPPHKFPSGRETAVLDAMGGPA